MCYGLIKNQQKFDHKSAIDSKLAFVLIMAWHRPGNEPFSEPVHRHTSPSLNVLKLVKGRLDAEIRVSNVSYSMLTQDSFIPILIDFAYACRPLEWT